MNLFSINKSSTFLMMIIFLNTFFTSASIENYKETNHEADLNQKKITISFGEKIPEKFVLSESLLDVKWSIKGENFNKNGIGVELLDLAFNLPGVYIITFNLDLENHNKNTHECSHTDLPNIIHLTVSEYKMKFLFDKMKLSQELKGDKEMAGTILEIPILFESYSKSPLKIENLAFITAGVNTTLQGKMNNSIELMEGINSVKFEMKGTTSKNTFIMFDFIDINNQTQSFSYPSKIK